MFQKAFTLIELLVVVAIIGLLGSVVLISLGGAKDKASLAQLQSFHSQVSHALAIEAEGLWSFEEASGDVARDRSGYGRDGNLGRMGEADCPAADSCPSWQTAAVCETGFDGCLHFDGADFVNFGQILHNLTTQLSVVAWFKVELPGPITGEIIATTTGKGVIAAKSQYAVNNSRWSLFVNYQTSPYELNWLVYDINNTNPSTQKIDIEQDRWYHVVAMWDEGVQKLYLDGKLIDSDVRSFTKLNVTSVARVTSGSENQGFSQPFTGFIDEIGIYGQVFTTQAIQDMYAQGLKSHQMVLQ